MSRPRSSISFTFDSLANNASSLNNTRLVEGINELKHQNRILRIENEILEKTLLRNDPTALTSIQSVMDNTIRARLSNTPSLSVVSILTGTGTSLTKQVKMPRSSMAKVSGISYLGNIKVNVQEKMELILTEVEQLQINLDKAKMRAKKKTGLLRSRLEEISMRVIDIDKAHAKFEKEVMEEGWDRLTQRISAETWIKFLHDWTRLSDKQVGKLRLRISTFNTQLQRIRSIMGVKRALNEYLRPVDLEKVEIEIKDCVTILERRYIQLADLKRITAKAHYNLTVHKKALMDQNNYLANLKMRIKEKTKLEQKYQHNSEELEKVVETVKDRLDKIRAAQVKFETPTILEYVRLKDELSQLHVSVKRLKNRLLITRRTIKSTQMRARRNTRSYFNNNLQQ